MGLKLSALPCPPAEYAQRCRKAAEVLQRKYGVLCPADVIDTARHCCLAVAQSLEKRARLVPGSWNGQTWFTIRDVATDEVVTCGFQQEVVVVAAQQQGYTVEEAP